MGLIVLIVVGGLLGWLATIILKIEDGRSIARSMIAGVFGSLAIGLILTRGNMLGGVSTATLLFAMLGSVVSIALYVVYRRRTVRENV